MPAEERERGGRLRVIEDDEDLMLAEERACDRRICITTSSVREGLEFAFTFTFAFAFVPRDIGVSVTLACVAPSSSRPSLWIASASVRKLTRKFMEFEPLLSVWLIRCTFLVVQQGGNEESLHIL